MQKVKPARCFLLSVVILLSFAALAKLATALGVSKALSRPDPLLAVVTTRQLYFCAALVEIAAVGTLLSRLDFNTCLSLTAALATAFLAYRFGLYMVGQPEPCQCLGSAGDWLGLGPEGVDTLAKWLLGYLWFGSYGFLAAGRWPRQRTMTGELVKA